MLDHELLRTSISPMAAQPTEKLSRWAERGRYAEGGTTTAPVFCGIMFVTCVHHCGRALTEMNHRRCAYSAVRRASSRYQALWFCYFDPVVILAEPKGGFDSIASCYDYHLITTSRKPRQLSVSVRQAFRSEPGLVNDRVKPCAHCEKDAFKNNNLIFGLSRI